MLGWFQKHRRKRYLKQPWPDSWSGFLKRNVRLVQGLSDNEMEALQGRIKIFIAEKFWEGCRGLELTEEMKVTIAAQASLMLLGVDDFYFDNVKTILVYPQSFRRQSDSGWLIDEEHRSGEAWQGGPIVLSWRDVVYGGRHRGDGRNLVIHEFAHALDGLDGEMGGNVSFEDEAIMERWKMVVSSDYHALLLAVRQGRHTFLDPYAATNLAEFFAVTSEMYFEEPYQLSQHHAELFDLLQAYYRVNPTAWQHTATQAD